MKYGIVLTAGDPRSIADLAAAAEEAGWDGAFYFDGLAIPGIDLYDPWVVMAAMAMRTSSIRLGAILTPPSRRRPWKLARETMTVDRLSGGRLIVPVGLGALDDLAFANVGEPTEARVRAELLDESLDILVGLWSGEPFAFEGRHFRFGEMTFRPTPVQRPRIPVWVAGAWPRERSMQRAVRWDGILPQAQDASGRPTDLTPEHVRAIADYGSRERAAAGRVGAFDIAVQGRTPPDDRAAAALEVQPWIDAGATWWIEAEWQDATVAGVRRRIEAGPPAVRPRIAGRRARHSADARR